MNALIKASKKNKFPASIDLVLSNNQKAYGLTIASSKNIKSYFFMKKEFEVNAQQILRKKKIEFI